MSKSQQYLDKSSTPHRPNCILTLRHLHEYDASKCQTSKSQYLDKKLEAHLKLDWYNEQAVKSEARRQANQPVRKRERGRGRDERPQMESNQPWRYNTTAVRHDCLDVPSSTETIFIFYLFFAHFTVLDNCRLPHWSLSSATTS